MSVGGDLGQAVTEAILIVLWWAIPLAFLGFVIYALVRYFNRPSARRGTPAEPPDSLELLRQRYARGEIDDAEYEHRRKVLTNA